MCLFSRLWTTCHSTRSSEALFPARNAITDPVSIRLLSAFLFLWGNWHFRVFKSTIMGAFQLPYFHRHTLSFTNRCGIDAAPDISLEYGGSRVVAIGNCLVVKYRAAVNLIEGEHMIFVRENTNIRVPKVYALYSNPTTAIQYIIMEGMPGKILLSL